jgi:hypothetical protein
VEYLNKMLHSKNRCGNCWQLWTLPKDEPCSTCVQLIKNKLVYTSYKPKLIEEEIPKDSKEIVDNLLEEIK